YLSYLAPKKILLIPWEVKCAEYTDLQAILQYTLVFYLYKTLDLLPTHLIKLFAQDEIFIKGIAEREPVGIFYTKGYTQITPLSKQPIQEVSWGKVEDEQTLKEIKALPRRFVYDLPSKPINPDDIKVKVIRPGVVSGRRSGRFVTEFLFRSFEYFLDAGKPRVRLFFDSLVERLERNKVKDSWPITIEIIYPKK
ncbi:MAG: hypothetical protein U9Q76_10165, partial [candidate division WOR-3 bacterium]|nr:hypothetical protein [candidate division WOR-3 bacterium]